MAHDVTSVDELRAARRGDDPEIPYLFPALAAGAWVLSVQADRHGYGCRPAERLDVLGAYERVEAAIRNPEGDLVHPAALGGLPEALLAAFPDGADEPPLGRGLGWHDVETLAARVAEMAAEAAPSP